MLFGNRKKKPKRGGWAEEKPFNTKVEKSRGKAVYVKGLRVFEHTDGSIHVTSSKDHTFCPKGSSIEKFFRKFLE